MINPLKLFRSIFKIEDSPEVIAKGFALGSFIGMMPIPGFQMFVSLAIASSIKVNKRAACVGVFNTNLFTGVFIFAFNYWLGKTILGITSTFVFPEKISIHFIATIFNAGTDVMLSLLVGGIFTGIVFALISYYIVKYLICLKRKKQYLNSI